ncbi:ribbon-helix-helix protein, CopG family [Alteromonas sp. NFXS44]|uniref:CopG family ribbon-helix-helix protein n=1 Tax=Alteromonas sp. NFXS44 TaxID=2818435 RepID=UPI0032DE9D41
MSITSVRLNDDIEKPLDSLAKKLDRSKSYLINQAVREFIARQAVDDARWEETLEAIESVNRGELIDDSEVNTWLNSWGSDKLKKTPSI